MPRAHIFIRNDDACTLDKKFQFFFDAARDHAVPVIYAVIPARMDKPFIRFLRKAKEKTPQLLDIVQHGWQHANHSSEFGRKYEFGPLRSVSQQRSDIQQGLQFMRSSFGDLFTPAFVPPYHGYNQETWDILCEEQFKIFSAGKNALKKRSGMIDLPAEISFTRYEHNVAAINPASFVIENLARNPKRSSLLGVLTHHADFKSASSRKELTSFFRQVAVSMERGIWRLLLFSDLIKQEALKC